ncbi:hypothetical protein J7L05_08760 [bacterium]|nr:hypothetical protein [bacterium]
MIDNPFDILLITVYAGYFLTAFLTLHLIKNIGFSGVLVGIFANALIHLNLIINGERLFLGKMPAGIDVLKGLLFLVILNVVITVGTYFILRSKNRSYKIPTALALLISSIFFWDCYIPAFFALIVLATPASEYSLD